MPTGCEKAEQVLAEVGDNIDRDGKTRLGHWRWDPGLGRVHRGEDHQIVLLS